jgi:hypothetical protein
MVMMEVMVPRGPSTVISHLPATAAGSSRAYTVMLGSSAHASANARSRVIGFILHLSPNSG